MYVNSMDFIRTKSFSFIWFLKIQQPTILDLNICINFIIDILVDNLILN